MRKATYVAALAALVGTAPVGAGGDPQAGKEKSAVCASCHGPDGNSAIEVNPLLAGQYESYLLEALKKYKSGERQNAVMNGMVAALSSQDLEDLAAWFASQEGKLTVLPYE